MIAKPSYNRGVANGSAKLTEATVREVRRMAAEGYSTRKIAAAVGCGHVTVHLIVAGKRWTHVT